jgi:hypothetical protein
MRRPLRSLQTPKNSSRHLSAWRCFMGEWSNVVFAPRPALHLAAVCSIVLLFTTSVVRVVGATEARIRAANPRLVCTMLAGQRPSRPLSQSFRQFQCSRTRPCWSMQHAGSLPGGRRLGAAAGPAAAGGATGSSPAGAAAARGRCTLVGAGPGPPDLLTLRAAKALAEADVVIYDELGAAEAALDAHARPGAERIYVGKRGGRQSIKQGEIDGILVDRCLRVRGARAQRLRGGGGRGGATVARVRARASSANGAAATRGAAAHGGSRTWPGCRAAAGAGRARGRKAPAADGRPLPRTPPPRDSASCASRAAAPRSSAASAASSRRLPLPAASATSCRACPLRSPRRCWQVGAARSCP